MKIITIKEEYRNLAKSDNIKKPWTHQAIPYIKLWLIEKLNEHEHI